MKTSLKKLVAGASILALVSMNALTYVNGANVSVGISAVDLGALSNDVTDDKVTVTIPANTVSADGKTLVIAVKDKSGIALDLTGKISGVTNTTTADTANIANGVISYVVTTAATAVTFDFTPGVANNFGISVVGDNGKIGSSVAYFGGANQVTVSAYVLPILSMSLSSNAINFGQLVPGTPNTKTVNVITASNAQNGVTVSVASTGLATGNTGTDKFIGALSRGTATATTGTDSYQIASSTTNGGNAIGAAQDIALSQNVLVADNVAKSNATTTVSLTATADNQTEAGNYNDTLTFTVTGTF